MTTTTTRCRARTSRSRPVGILSFKAALEHRGGLRLRLLEVEVPAGSGTGPSADPRRSTPTPRPTRRDRHRRGQHDLRAGDLRPVGLRRSDDRLPARYATDGGVQGQDPGLGWAGCSSTTSRSPTAPPRCLRRRRGEPARRLGARRVQPRWARASRRLRPVLPGQQPAPTSPTTSTSRPVPTSASRTGRTSWRSSPTRTACWSTTGTRRSPTTTPAPTPVAGAAGGREPAGALQPAGPAWRGRIQTYDAPFGLQKSDSFYLPAGGRKSYIRGANAKPLFDDTNPNRYFKP